MPINVDRVQSFQLPNLQIRGRLVRLGPALDAIIKGHNYPHWVAFQLVEALLVNTAIAFSIKLQGRVSFQIRSEGAIKLIATDVTPSDVPGTLPSVRGYVNFDEAAHQKGAPDLENGFLGIIINTPAQKEAYKGITPLSKSLSESAENYFLQSEQIPTKFHVDISYSPKDERWSGGAIMLQEVAKTGGNAPQADSSAVSENEAWDRVNALLRTLTVDELLSDDLGGENLIFRLFHEEDPTANPPQPVEFRCTCSRERVVQSLSIYSTKDLQHMIKPDGTITADCQFCGAHYVMDPSECGFESKNK